MRQDFDVVIQRRDNQGNPTGGETRAVGLDIRWQDGSIGHPPDHDKINGTFVETVIMAAYERLMCYQSSPMHCDEYEDALRHLFFALQDLDLRRERLAEQQTGGV